MRIVGLGRGGERLVAEPLRRRERGLDVAALQLQSPRVSEDGRVGISRSRVSAALLVFDPDRPRRRGCLLRVCATTMAMCWPWCRMRSSLKGVAGLGPSGVIGPCASAGAFLCVTTASTPGDGLRALCVDSADRASGDRRLHQDGMRQAGEAEVRRVRCGARHLQRAVDAVDAGPDDRVALGRGHGSIPATVCRIRTIVRLAELDLERRAGNRERVLDRGLRRGIGRCRKSRSHPASIASASRARHGIVPTPPTATRAVAIVPSSITSAAAAEVSANSYDALSRTFR